MTVALLAACGDGSAGENEGGLIGVVPGSEQTTTTAIQGDDSSESTVESDGCPPNELCEMLVELGEIPLEVDVASLTLSSADALWVVSSDPGSLIEVDLTARTVLRTLSVENGSVDLAVEDGELWVVVNEFGSGRLLRLDAELGELVAEIGSEISGGPRSVALGGGAVWTVLDGYGRVGHVDPATHELTVIGDGGSEVGGAVETPIVFAHDLVWVVDASAGSVKRVDPASEAIVDIIDELGRRTVEQSDVTSILARGPLGLAVVPDGVWVLSETSSEEEGTNVIRGALFLLAADTGEIREQIDLLSGPAFGRPGLAVREGAAWYIDGANGQLVRVDLETGRQTFLRTPGFGALATALLAAEGVIYFGTEGGFDNPGAVYIVDAEAAAISSTR